MMMTVSRMIATTMLPVRLSSTTSRMNRAWKTGVNAHESRSHGVAPSGWAVSGSCGVAVGVALGEDPGTPTEHAETTRATTTTRRNGASRVRSCFVRVTRSSSSV